MNQPNSHAQRHQARTTATDNSTTGQRGHDSHINHANSIQGSVREGNSQIGASRDGTAAIGAESRAHAVSGNMTGASSSRPARGTHHQSTTVSISSIRDASSRAASRAVGATSTSSRRVGGGAAATRDFSVPDVLADADSEAGSTTEGQGEMDAHKEGLERQDEPLRRRRRAMTARRRLLGREASPEDSGARQAVGREKGPDADVPVVEEDIEVRAAAAEAAAALHAQSLDIVKRQPDGSYILGLAEPPGLLRSQTSSSAIWGFDHQHEGLSYDPNEEGAVDKSQAAELDRHYATAARQYFTSGAAVPGRSSGRRRHDEPMESLKLPMMLRLREQALQQLEDERWQYEAVDRMADIA